MNSPDFELVELCSLLRDPLNPRRMSEAQVAKLRNSIVEFGFFIHQLYEAGDVLREIPIMIDSGQHEPIYDRPRTYADVEREIASNLVNLGIFRARCKLTAAGAWREYSLKTPGYRAPELGDAQIGERVRERSRRLYARERLVVQDEIHRRAMAFGVDKVDEEAPTMRLAPLDEPPELAP